MKKKINPTESNTAQLDYKAILNHCELIRRFDKALTTCSVLFLFFIHFVDTPARSNSSNVSLILANSFESDMTRDDSRL